MAKEEENKALQNVVDAPAPAFMAEDAGKYDQAMKTDDIMLPRLSLAQDMSEQTKKREALYIEGLEVGEFFNNVTSEIYGGVLQFIPIKFFRQRIYFKEERGTGEHCRSMNGETGGVLHPESCDSCQYSKFADGQPPVCTEFKNWLIAMLHPQTGMLVMTVLPFKVTSLTAGKRLNTLISAKTFVDPNSGEQHLYPPFAGLYNLKAIEDKNAKGSFFNYQVRAMGWAEQSQYDFCKRMADQFEGQTVNYKEDDSSEPSDPQDANATTDTEGVGEGEPAF